MRVIPSHPIFKENMLPEGIEKASKELKGVTGWQNSTELEMIGVSKSFPGVKALDGINLKVRPGTVHALMGENGAGKSTLMKCLFGIYKMDEDRSS